MARKKLIDRYEAALLARGYTRDVTARSTRFVVLLSPTEGGNPVTRGQHRVLLGKAGSLRLTRGTIDASIDVSGRLSKTLLSEVE